MLKTQICVTRPQCVKILLKICIFFCFVIVNSTLYGNYSCSSTNKLASAIFIHRYMGKGHGSIRCSAEVRVVSAVCLQLKWLVSCTPDIFVTRMSHFDSQIDIYLSSIQPLGRFSRNQSPSRRPVWLWHTASWASS